MVKFSVCTIMKNEGDNLPRFLDILLEYDLEIVLVDTGSTDDSIKIAQERGISVYYYNWINDFAAARNFAIQQAGNDHIISLDCDEFIKKLDLRELEQCVERNPGAVGLINIINYMIPNSEKGAYYDRIARIFDRREYHFEGRIHEQLKPLIKTGNEIKGYYAPFDVIHTGYIAESDISEDKFNRNINMIKAELERDSSNLYLHFQLAQELYNHEKYEAAEREFKYVLDNAALRTGVEFHRLSVMGYTDCLLHQAKYKLALESKKYIDTFGYTPDLHFVMGVAYYLNHDFLNSMQEMIIATSMNNPAKEGTNTYMPLYYIGLVNEQLGNCEEAGKFYEMCGDYEPALERLEDIRTGE